MRSVDGKALLLVQRNSIAGLWVQDTGQSSQPARQIASEVGGFEDVSWTPDGKVVYRSNSGGGSDVWIVDSDGTTPCS